MKTRGYQAEEVLDAVIVTGTRRLDRTVTESPVPIDVFRGEKLRNVGTGDMDDIPRTLNPSYLVRRFPINDEASLVRPATLRRLPRHLPENGPDSGSELILVELK